MRLLAIALVVFTGALMAIAGAVVRGFGNYGSDLEGIGGFVVFGSLVMFVIEWWPVPATKKNAGNVPAEARGNTA